MVAAEAQREAVAGPRPHGNSELEPSSLWDLVKRFFFSSTTEVPLHINKN